MTEILFKKKLYFLFENQIWTRRLTFRFINKEYTSESENPKGKFN